MPSTGKPIRLGPVVDKDVDANFTQVRRALLELSPLAGEHDPAANRTTLGLGDAAVGKLTPLTTLAVGVNAITPTVANPVGRITAFQSAVSNIYDIGLNRATGKWEVNSSAVCSVRFLFI